MAGATAAPRTAGRQLPRTAWRGSLAYMALFAVLCSSFSLAVCDQADRAQQTVPTPQGPMLWYRAPASRWEEALPVGNGRLGAMVHGGVPREVLQLNEDSVWSGGPVERDRKGASRHLAEARRLFFAGEVVAGQRLMQREFMSEEPRPSHQTLGELALEWRTLGTIDDYRRELDLDAAIATTTFRSGATAYREEVFASAPDDVLVVRLTREGPDPIDVDVALSRARGATVTHSADGASLDGRAWTARHADESARHRDARRDGGASGEGYWRALAAGDRGWREDWKSASLDDAAWQPIELPGPWSGTALAAIDGLVWFRREVVLPASLAGRELALELGAIDDSDLTLWDGEPVGDTVQAWQQPRRYTIPAARATAGRHVLCVLVHDSGGEGGFAAKPDAFVLRTADGAETVLPLAGAWRWRHDARPLVPDDDLGVRFAARLVVRGDARVTPREDSLELRGASEVVLLLGARTDYRGDEPTERAASDVAATARRSFAELQQRHLTEHRRLFRRVSLDLGGAERRALPTDARLAALRAGGDDPDLCATWFQFGRYLLIASSRPGALPANLQGLWNRHFEAPWNADYHININLQMNYWPAEVTNLAECHLPMFDLVDGLARRGRATARELYDCPGWVAHHTTDAWHFTSPIGQTVWGLWPTGGAWCTRHLWEHWEFGRDRAFLRERAWPLLRGAAEFFVAYLCEDPDTGLLVSGPSSSPENRFRTDDGQVADTCMGATMDQMIVHDLFTNVLLAGRELGLHDSDPLVARVEQALSRLAGPRLGSDGRLLEWSREYAEVEPGHRHMSHLFGLHPGRQITRHTPELFAAARKVIDHRLAHGGGHTGWSRAWIVNFFARLRDGDSARDNVLALLRKSTLPNLFDDHPPFQIDGNFGGSAGIAEMLVQSHDGEIALLPALPRAWRDGEVRGLRVRGGAELDLRWRDGVLAGAMLRAAQPFRARLRLGEATTEVELAAGSSRALSRGDFGR